MEYHDISSIQLGAKKEEHAAITPVATGEIKKKSELQRVSDAFISEEIKHYILYDVLLKSAKKALSGTTKTIADAISEVFKNGIDILLYGEVEPERKTSGSKISYSSYYNDRTSAPAPKMSVSRGSGFDDLKYNTRIEAEEVLTTMDEIVSRDGSVSVLIMYDLSSQVAPSTANNYGWYNLKEAKVVPTSDGKYWLKMPKAVLLR